MLKTTLAILFLLMVCCQTKKKAPVQEKLPQSEAMIIAFGSCSDEDLPQKLWPMVVKNHPDLFIWLGDNIYADTEDMSVMKAKYDKQKSDPGYQELLRTTPVIGIWDDHDYGENDGGKEYPKKDDSKALMLEFLDVPRDNPVWQHEGAYQSYVYGEKGQKVKIILPDTRYFRDPLKKSGDKSRPYLPDPDGDLLGEDQWKWLEKELQTSDAEVNIIGSSIQLVSQRHGWEQWDNFPQSKQRLLELLASTNVKRPFIISGDRHFAEISKMDVEGLTHPLYDVTSSSLTHGWTWGPVAENRNRVGAHTAKVNFGIVRIDWRTEPLEITFHIKGEADSVLIAKKVFL